MRRTVPSRGDVGVIAVVVIGVWPVVRTPIPDIVIIIASLADGVLTCQIVEVPRIARIVTTAATGQRHCGENR